jgi:hypothetical protein
MREQGADCSTDGCDGFAHYAIISERIQPLKGGFQTAVPSDSPVGPMKCEHGHEAMYKLSDLRIRNVPETPPRMQPRDFTRR